MIIEVLSKEFKKRIINDQHLKEVVEKSSVAFTIKVFATLFKILLSVIIARLLGASGAGVYFLTIAIVTVASVVGKLGVDGTLLRFIAEAAEEGDFPQIRRIYKSGAFIVLTASFGVSLFLFSFADFLAIRVFDDMNLVRPLQVASLTIIPLSLLALVSESFRALKKIKYSMVLSELAIPALTIPLIVIFGSLNGVIGGIIAYSLSVILIFFLGRKKWQDELHAFPDTQSNVDVERPLMGVSLSLFWISFTMVVMAWTDTIVLAMWSDSTDVGIYNVAMRISMMTSSVLVAVNSIMAPKFSSLLVRGDLRELEELGRRVTRIMVLCVSPVLFLFIFFPGFFLSIFGNEFLVGSDVLIILSIGQLINVATGSVGYLLIMSGFEKQLRNNSLLVAVLNIFLNLILVPEYGITGAAFASALSVALMNVISTIIVYKKLTISILPIPGRAGI